MAAEIIIAGISATMQAVDLWATLRDRKKANNAFKETYPKINSDRQLQLEATQLENLVPVDVLNNMQVRVERCWTSYNDVLVDEDGYLPNEVDSATVAVKKCICRELRRIRDLNGSIPPGILSKWWDKYCMNQP
ncbi:MAG TPA: hypothetical protein VMF88_10585 [Bacteroidota bacterium]|nr:hypothetical protein [Bacteroidota bacterium]